MKRTIFRVVPVIVAMLFTGCESDIFENKPLSDTVWSLVGEYYEDSNEQGSIIQFLNSDGYATELLDLSTITYQGQGLVYYNGSYLLTEAIDGFDSVAIFEIGNSAGTVYTNSISFRNINVNPLEDIELGEPYTVSWENPIAENETVDVTISQELSSGESVTIFSGSTSSVGDTSYIFENTYENADSSDKLEVLVRRVYKTDLTNNGGLSGGYIYSSYVATPVEISIINNF